VPRELILDFVDDHVSTRALLLEDEAPATCRTIWDLLPAAGPLGHAAYSGTLVALYIDPRVTVPVENATTCVQTGDVMFTHYDAMVRHGHPDALSEIHWAYDRYARPTIPGQWLPATANVFARIPATAEAFFRVCQEIRRGGVKRMEIRRGDTSA
jgi:hypothetical protein